MLCNDGKNSGVTPRENDGIQLMMASISRECLTFVIRIISSQCLLLLSVGSAGEERGESGQDRLRRAYNPAILDEDEFHVGFRDQRSGGMRCNTLMDAVKHVVLDEYAGGDLPLSMAGGDRERE